MSYTKRRKAEIQGDRCGNCGAPGPEHWQRPGWEEPGRYTCEKKPIAPHPDSLRLAKLIDLCDSLFHTVSFQEPLSKGQHITEQMRSVVYEKGKETPIAARKLLAAFPSPVREQP